MCNAIIIAPQSGQSIEVRKGQKIIVTDIEGGQVADFFAQAKEDADEFLSTGVTIDCNESLRLNIGDCIYSNLYRPMLRVIYDDVGEHDLLHPCCRRERYGFFYHNGGGHANCLDNINACMGSNRKIIHPVNLFMHTEIGNDGKIKVLPPLSKPGDKIILRAERDLLLGIAACSVSESDCNSGKCTAIRVDLED